MDQAGLQGVGCELKPRVQLSGDRGAREEKKWSPRKQFWDGKLTEKV